MRLLDRLERGVARRRWALLYLLACAALVLGLRGRAWEHLATLNGEEWQPIQDFVRPNRQGDEPICFLPRWTRGHAVDQYKFRGIDLLGEPEEAWRGLDEPLAGFWVVSQFEAFDPDRVPRDVYPHRAHREMGGADVYLFRREPFELPDSLVFHLRRARCVLHGPGERAVPLVWDRIGYALPRRAPGAGDLGYIGCHLSRDRFAGAPRYGVWFHPPPAGQSLSITWPEVDLLPWLGVSGGLRDHVASGRGDPVRLQVILDGRTLSTLTFPSQRGWKTFAFETGRGEGTGRLSFKVSSPRNHSRHFFFDAAFSAERPAAARREPRPGVRPVGARSRADARLRDAPVGAPEEGDHDADPGAAEAADDPEGRPEPLR